LVKAIFTELDNLFDLYHILLKKISIKLEYSRINYKE